MLTKEEQLAWHEAEVVRLKYELGRYPRTRHYREKGKKIELSRLYNMWKAGHMTDLLLRKTTLKTLWMYDRSWSYSQAKAMRQLFVKYKTYTASELAFKEALASDSRELMELPSDYKPMLKTVYSMVNKIGYKIDV